MAAGVPMASMSFARDLRSSEFSSVSPRMKFARTICFCSTTRISLPSTTPTFTQFHRFISKMSWWDGARHSFMSVTSAR